MNPKKYNIQTSLEGVNFVLLKFEFTNETRVPKGIPLLVRTKEQLDALAERRRIEAAQQKERNPQGYTGSQWMKNIQSVTPEMLHITLDNEGFDLDKVEHTAREPAAGEKNRTPKHVVLVRYVRKSHIGAPGYEKPEAEQTINAENNGAVLKLLMTTWGFVHAFNNLPSGNDTISVSFLHLKTPADRQLALVAWEGSVLCLSTESVEKLVGMPFCDPKLYADEVKQTERRDQSRPPQGRQGDRRRDDRHGRGRDQRPQPRQPANQPLPNYGQPVGPRGRHAERREHRLFQDGVHVPPPVQEPMVGLEAAFKTAKK